MKRSDRLVEVGLIAKPHGIRGEVKADLFFISVKMFSEMKKVWLELDDFPEWFTIESTREQNGRAILKLSGVDDRNRAEDLRNIRLFADSADIPEAGDKTGFFNVSGFQVFTLSGHFVGIVKEVLAFPAQNMLVIDSQGKEILVPAVEEFIKNVDADENKIFIDPIDGLLNTDEI